MISVTETEPGVLQVLIPAGSYGLTGQHWRNILSGPNHKGYGKIFIQRYGANRRRYESCYNFRGYYRGFPNINIDECPGAMFIWNGPKFAAHTEAVDAYSNQALGRDLGNALRAYEQKSEEELWEVRFRFI